MHVSNALSSTSRRRFLLTSAAAFASLHSLPSFPQATNSSDTAIPRGRKRNLLQHACTPEALAAALLPADRYHPFPTAADRTAWQAVLPGTRAALLAAGEKHLGYKWPEMPATLFLEYARNGNRTHYEAVRTARLNAVRALAYAECVEGKGRFLDDLVNGLWATCEESFWGVPAHLYIQKADLGLPDPRDPIVDLFAAETAALLATAVYLLGPELDRVSPLVRDRVYFESERRIFDPLLKQNFMWMGLPGGKTRHDLPWLTIAEGKVQPVNNWDAWICWNWLTTTLFLDKNEQRRQQSVQKIMLCLDNFINSYPDDGGCEEGPHYWNVASGAMFDALELLHSATNGAMDIYRNPLITEMALYLNRVHVDGKYYLNPGDATATMQLSTDKVFRYGSRVGNQALISLAVSSLPADYVPDTLPAIFNEAALRAHAPATAPLYRDAWLPETAIMAARRKANSSEGLYLGCLASDNGKSHSHNDTGNFWVFNNGEPVLVDIGRETYQKKSFDAHRYEILSTQSGYHNLPTIGGVDQQAGPQFRATDLKYAADDSRAELSMELRSAYPASAHLRSYRRTARLLRKENEINIEDVYQLDGPAAEIILNLITCCKVTAREGMLQLANRASIQFDPRLLRPTVETMHFTDEELIHNWGNELYRIRLATIQPATNGTLKLRIQSA